VKKTEGRFGDGIKIEFKNRFTEGALTWEEIKDGPSSKTAHLNGWIGLPFSDLKTKNTGGNTKETYNLNLSTSARLSSPCIFDTLLPKLDRSVLPF
jgi:hypothetical protein